MVSKDEIIKSADLIKNIEVKNVRPESIIINTGQINIKKIPIVPDIEIIPADGFTVVGKIKIDPDTVIIKGNSKIIKDIHFWHTEKLHIVDKIKSFDFTINLKDSLRNIITINPNKVKILVNIQQSAQKEIPDVEIKITGKQLPQDYIIIPQKISVVISGGINEINKITSNDVSASINYGEVMIDSLGIFKPEVKTPENVKLLSTKPPIIRIIKQTK
jgi:hypothetical protein